LYIFWEPDTGKLRSNFTEYSTLPVKELWRTGETAYNIYRSTGRGLAQQMTASVITIYMQFTTVTASHLSIAAP
jgi:hypothetical protein